MYLYKLTEYQILDQPDIENVQTSMKFDTTDIQIAIPTDLAIYWRVNSLFFFSAKGKNARKNTLKRLNNSKFSFQTFIILELVDSSTVSPK